MKTKKTITKILSAAVTLVTATSGWAQNDLGSSCGCPPVSSRPEQTLSSFNVNGTDLTTQTLTCDKNWIIDGRTFVGNGQVLTIQPGTVIKAKKHSTNDSATALVISRGGKIMADGTKDCPIVFTAYQDNLQGNTHITDKGLWGGVLIAGKAQNNLTIAANGPHVANTSGKLCVAVADGGGDGIGIFEGFGPIDSRLYFGNAPASFDNHDNSGVLRYVSIRFSGAILNVGSEINGLSLGSVGDGTMIDHIDIVSCADDGIEFFGGTVNVKYYSSLFGNDDMFDYDLGYSGKAQFVFGLQAATSCASPDSDNAFEMDSDDDKSGNTPRSHPIFYNMTLIGANKTTKTSDNSSLAGLNAKELTEGEIYNSLFANFSIGVNMTKSVGTRTTSANIINSVTSEAYHNWANTGGNNTNTLKIKCNTFVSSSNKTFALNGNGTAVSSTDSTQFFTTDKNVAVSSLPGFTYAFAATCSNNTITTKPDVTPNPAIVVGGCPTPSADMFFSPVTYRGAFDSTAPNWLQSWSYSQVLNEIGGGAFSPCPSDTDGDGDTDIDDFSNVIGGFGTNCQ